MFCKMRLVLCILLYLIVTSTPLKVLWIGNSFTYYNDLPQMVADIANANGLEYQFESHLEGGWSWEDHAGSDVTAEKIRSQPWDVVILQDYSTYAAYDADTVCDQSVPFLDTLVSMIHDNNPDTMIQFYLTWGWPHGAPDLCSQGMQQFCSYETMQDALSEGYMNYTCMNKPSKAAPVGEAFRNIKMTYGDNFFLQLYKDFGGDKHPSLYGSFISAVTNFMTLYDLTEAPSNLPTFDIVPDWVNILLYASVAAVNQQSWTVGADEVCQGLNC